LHVWDRVLALPVLGSLSGERAASLMERLLTEIQRTRSAWAILDVTGVDIIDTHTANHLLRVARAVELLGARCIITGIQPAVAQTMVALEASFAGIVTRATLRDGLKYCMGPRA
jgi:rsbT co-antagonist protein RsbR